jgi:hypothetical protein
MYIQWKSQCEQFNQKEKDLATNKVKQGIHHPNATVQPKRHQQSGGGKGS